MAKSATVKIGPEIDKKLYAKFSKVAAENGQSVRFVLERAMENYVQLTFAARLIRTGNFTNFWPRARCQGAFTRPLRKLKSSTSN